MKKSIGAKTIIFPTPVLVIGTYDKSEKPNLMTAAWGGICCSRPPCVAISLRKASLHVPRPGQHSTEITAKGEERDHFHGPAGSLWHYCLWHRL